MSLSSNPFMEIPESAQLTSLNDTPDPDIKYPGADNAELRRAHLPIFPATNQDLGFQLYLERNTRMRKHTFVKVNEVYPLPLKVLEPLQGGRRRQRRLDSLSVDWLKRSTPWYQHQIAQGLKAPFGTDDARTSPTNQAGTNISLLD